MGWGGGYLVIDCVASHPGGVTIIIFLVASCYKKREFSAAMGPTRFVKTYRTCVILFLRYYSQAAIF